MRDRDAAVEGPRPRFGTEGATRRNYTPANVSSGAGGRWEASWRRVGRGSGALASQRIRDQRDARCSAAPGAVDAPCTRSRARPGSKGAVGPPSAGRAAWADPRGEGVDPRVDRAGDHVGMSTNSFVFNQMFRALHPFVRLVHRVGKTEERRRVKGRVGFWLHGRECPEQTWRAWEIFLGAAGAGPARR